jgi:hypothetical protein
MTRILLYPPLLLFAILASHGEDPPAIPGPAPVRIVVVALDARIVYPFEQKPFLVIIATGVTPTGGYSDPRLMALPGRTLEFELMATLPAARFEGEPDEAEAVMHASLKLPMPERLPVTVRVVQPERFISRRVD